MIETHLTTHVEIRPLDILLLIHKCRNILQIDVRCPFVDNRKNSNTKLISRKPKRCKVLNFQFNSLHLWGSTCFLHLSIIDGCYVQGSHPLLKTTLNFQDNSVLCAVNHLHSTLLLAEYLVDWCSDNELRAKWKLVLTVCSSLFLLTLPAEQKTFDVTLVCTAPRRTDRLPPNGKGCRII
jgi:hypothetical protein